MLGQPRTQYGNEDFQTRKRIGTGLFNNSNISMRGKILPKGLMNLPSMMGSDKTTTVAGGQSLNITNIGSFQNNEQKPTLSFGRKNQHSIFSNFSGPPENIIQDVNYT